MYILADIGGTKTRIARSDDLESFSEPVIFETPQAYEEGIVAVVAAIGELAGGQHIAHVSIGAPGVVSPDYRSVMTAPNLTDWAGRSLGEDIETAFSTRAHIENDAALVGLGEAVFGAGKGVSIMMYITVSTGVGAARIVDGRINAPSRSAEIGHMYFNTGTELQKFSSLVSGKKIRERFGVNPRDLGKNHPVWEELARLVAIGVHNSILHWTPDRVVLGGSMFNEIGIPVDRVQAHIAEIMKALPTIPHIVHSELGDLGGLWGGMARLKQLG